MRHKITALFLLFLLPFGIRAQSYSLESYSTDSTGCKAWKVLEKDQQNATRLIGEFPCFWKGYGYLHAPQIVGNKIYFGFVSPMRGRNGRALDTMVFGAFQIGSDTITLIEHFARRLPFRGSRCDLLIDEDFLYLRYVVGIGFHSGVRIHLLNYQIGYFEKVYDHFIRTCRPNRRLENVFFQRHIDDI